VETNVLIFRSARIIHRVNIIAGFSWVFWWSFL